MHDEPFAASLQVGHGERARHMDLVERLVHCLQSLQEPTCLACRHEYYKVCKTGWSRVGELYKRSGVIG